MCLRRLTFLRMELPDIGRYAVREYVMRMAAYFAAEMIFCSSRTCWRCVS